VFPHSGFAGKHSFSSTIESVPNPDARETRQRAVQRGARSVSAPEIIAALESRHPRDVPEAVLIGLGGPPGRYVFARADDPRGALGRTGDLEALGPLSDAFWDADPRPGHESAEA
jgi:hypothetical protein